MTDHPSSWRHVGGGRWERRYRRSGLLQPLLLIVEDETFHGIENAAWAVLEPSTWARSGWLQLYAGQVAGKSGVRLAKRHAENVAKKVRKVGSYKGYRTGEYRSGPRRSNMAACRTTKGKFKKCGGSKRRAVMRSLRRSAGGGAKARVTGRQMILTKYISPTNTHGSRIKAQSESGQSVTVSYKSELSVVGNHEAACIALADKLGWGGNWVGSSTKRGYNFVDVS